MPSAVCARAFAYCHTSAHILLHLSLPGPTHLPLDEYTPAVCPGIPVLMATSWDGLGKDARRLESDIDAKLALFARTTASLTSIRGPGLGGPATRISTATATGDGEFDSLPGCCACPLVATLVVSGARLLVLPWCLPARTSRWMTYSRGSGCGTLLLVRCRLAFYLCCLCTCYPACRWRLSFALVCCVWLCAGGTGDLLADMHACTCGLVVYCFLFLVTLPPSPRSRSATVCRRPQWQRRDRYLRRRRARSH